MVRSHSPQLNDIATYNMKEKLAVINGTNLQQAIQLANKESIKREDLVGIINMPNSREFNIVYWKQYEQ